jgi:hypothetical protein
MSWMIGEGSMQTRQSAILVLPFSRDTESQGGPPFAWRLSFGTV